MGLISGRSNLYLAICLPAKNRKAPYYFRRDTTKIHRHHNPKPKRTTMIFFKKVLVIALFFLVFLGVPYLIGNYWNLIWSWIPAFGFTIYLDETVVKKQPHGN
jgi:hypothetical protein